jgi:enoyl-CoA hydratase/carnithine racemase
MTLSRLTQISSSGQPEIVLGLIPGGGGTQMLTRMLGPAQALELCLEGTLISGEEALKYGLITKLVSREQLMPEAMAIAERMARRNPAAVAAIKDCVHTGGSSPLAVGIRREQGGFGTSALVPEAANAMTKYLSGIDELLGPKSNLADFQSWKDGTAVDFTPGSARKLQASKKQV